MAGLPPPSPDPPVTITDYDWSLVVKLMMSGFKKPGFFKKAQPSGFYCFGVLLGFFGEAGEIGKRIQKLSNLKL